MQPESPTKAALQGQNGNTNITTTITKQTDIESGKVTAIPGSEALYPNMVDDPKLRWVFIRKVYFILAVQFLFTAAIAATFNRVRPIPQFVQKGSRVAIVLYIVIVLLPFVALVPMLHFRKRHPVNMFFLALFTICISLLVGWMAALLNGVFMLESAFATTAVLVVLTLYTFWAAKRGHDFIFLGPFLLISLTLLLIYLVFLLWVPSRTGFSIYACLATIVFSGFLIFDTENLIKRHSYDEYTCAAVSLYLDVVNLFMSILGIPAFGF